MVRVAHVSKAFGEGRVVAGVLTDVTFVLRRGRTTSLVGESGSGKSTLVAILAGLMLPDSGTIMFDGADVTSVDDGTRARLRAQRIGVVLQGSNLIAFLTAAENVELAMRLAGGERRRPRTAALLADLGLAHRADHLPRHMSGGEVQRVALAVGLANDPDLLLADEVTGELDTATAEHVMDVIDRQASQRALTVLFTTHSPDLAARAQDRLRLVDGEVRPA